MTRRWVKLHVEVEDDDDYAEMANAVWMVLQAPRRRGSVEPDGRTNPQILDDWWQSSVDERTWS